MFVFLDLIFGTHLSFIIHNVRKLTFFRSSLIWYEFFLKKYLKFCDLKIVSNICVTINHSIKDKINILELNYY